MPRTKAFKAAEPGFSWPEREDILGFVVGPAQDGKRQVEVNARLKDVNGAEIKGPNVSRVVEVTDTTDADGKVTIDTQDLADKLGPALGLMQGDPPAESQRP